MGFTIFEFMQSARVKPKIALYLLDISSIYVYKFVSPGDKDEYTFSHALIYK